MKYMLDTNICIYIIKKRPPEVLKKFEAFGPEEIAISSISYAELVYGIEKSQHAQQNFDALEEFVSPLKILTFDDYAATHYGQIRALLEKQGTPIGPLDLMIGAHARSIHTTLVTNNIKEFSRIPKLKIENWAI